MKIAVNTRLLLKGKLDGIGRFTAETLQRITRLHPECQFIFIFDRPFSEDFIFSDNITPVIAGPQSRHPFLWYMWFEYALPAVLKKHQPDLFLSPDGYLPLKSGTPSLAVIHDINFMHRPDFHPFITGTYYRYFFPKFASAATRIATVSEFSKSDINKTFKIDKEKIDVVYNGAADIYSPITEDEKRAVKNKLTRGKEYFLFVGSFHKRKNVAGLLEAYDHFRKETGKDIKLVLVGELMYGYSLMKRTIEAMHFREDVIFAGRMEPQGLRSVYGASVALVYVPFFEGFGIPLIEAMNCGTALIASNRTSLPEVAGDAAYMVDPDNRNSIVEGMARLASDSNFRNKLTERALARKNMFSWKLTSELLWDSLEKTYVSSRQKGC